MNIIGALFRRELQSYFATPVAYVFIVIFLVLMGTFTFYLGGFYEQGQADLRAFFNFHPWLYLFLVPAISMRLWAEERKTGSVELLMTLPITPWEAVLGKYLAAWAFTGIALALTFPIWITVNYLGDPDNGTILAAYVGSLLMAAASWPSVLVCRQSPGTRSLRLSSASSSVSVSCSPGSRWCSMSSAAGRRRSSWMRSPR